MEDYSIEDYQIFGGTAYDGDYARYGSQNARLHSSFGYRAEPSADTARDIYNSNHIERGDGNYWNSHTRVWWTWRSGMGHGLLFVIYVF